ncbi:hypothetical protein ACFLZN_00215 [Nanoarchaeota archaeon]
MRYNKTQKKALVRVFKSSTLQDVFWLTAREQINETGYNTNKYLAKLYAELHKQKLSSPKVMSQHLKVLRDSGLLKRGLKKGRLQFYEVDYSTLTQIVVEAEVEDYKPPFMVPYDTYLRDVFQIVKNKNLVQQAADILEKKHLPAIVKRRIEFQFERSGMFKDFLTSMLHCTQGFFLKDIPITLNLMTSKQRKKMLSDPLIKCIWEFQKLITNDFVEDIQEEFPEGIIIKNILQG